MEATSAPSRDRSIADDARVEKLLQHLNRVQTDPATPLEDDFLEECELILPLQLEKRHEQVFEIVRVSAHLLPELQQDASPLVKLLTRLVRMVSFTDVMSLDPPVDLVGGLDVRAGVFNDLILSVLQLATKSAVDAAHLASLHLVIRSLVLLWLATPEMAIAEKAAEVILGLLAVDSDPPDATILNDGGDDSQHGARGQGLMWRRIFGDRDIYGLLFSLTSFSGAPSVEGVPNLSKKQKSLAQARLMSALPRIGALDWYTVSRSHHAEIESAFGLDPSREGFIDFVLVHMADWKDDVLIHMHLVQICGELLTTVKAPSSSRHISVSLEYLTSIKLHERACSFWLSPEDPSHDPVDMNFLYAPSASYISSYLETYPEAFLASSLAKPILQRLSKALDLSANQWSQGSSQSPSLNILASIPRIALLPLRSLGAGRRSSAFLQLPCRSTNASALKTIAHIISGPERPAETFPVSDDPLDDIRYKSGAACARVLYYLYKSYQDSLFGDLISHASTVALPEQAIAAMQVMSAIATARWEPLPASSEYAESEMATSLQALPAQDQFTRLFPNGPTTEVSDTGIAALLERGVREQFFPWLLKPPQTFAHLVGGGGAAESSAYRVAMAKWDMLQLVHARLEQHVEQHGGREQDTLRALQGRLAEGPWGSSSGAGSRIGTLEL